MTPTRLSRIQEKNVLASLNDRLAAYIDRNQQLENENATMARTVSEDFNVKGNTALLIEKIVLLMLIILCRII
jgi:uncharacterized protein (UPF0335 family)